MASKKFIENTALIQKLDLKVQFKLADIPMEYKLQSDFRLVPLLPTDLLLTVDQQEMYIRTLRTNVTLATRMGDAYRTSVRTAKLKAKPVRHRSNNPLRETA